MRHATIRLSHGSGGQLTRELIEGVFAPRFGSDSNADAAVLGSPAGRLAVSTDGHSVAPLFFPGGDIGVLAVAGTVNDLAVVGAQPLYMTAAFILEEGFPVDQLERIADSMAATARRAGVTIVAGDTKVVERGKGDGVFIATTGIGLVPEGRELGLERIRVGDRLLVNGTLGDHGMAIMSQREGFELELNLTSDVAPLNELVESVLAAGGKAVRFMRDLTRGGLAAAANEAVAGRSYGFLLYEERLPMNGDVVEYAEMLGIDPLLSANEGKMLVVVAPEQSEAVLSAMKSHPLGGHAAEVGEVIREPNGKVVLETAFGSLRLIEMPVEEQLPRIC